VDGNQSTVVEVEKAIKTNGGTLYEHFANEIAEHL
jgi:hypothetical protein